MPDKRDESFGKLHRLNKSTDFRRVLSRGKRTATPYFVVYTLTNRLPISRLGIQIRARIGNAVRRNYLKRIVREVFRRVMNNFREPMDFIVIAEKSMAELKYQQLNHELRKVLERYRR